MEGIPAKSSTAGLTTLDNFAGATSAKNTAVRSPIGTPIIIAIAVPAIDVRMT